MNIKHLLVSGVLLCLGISSQAQVSMTGVSRKLHQDFNTLPTTGSTNVWTDNSTISNWYSLFFCCHIIAILNI